MLAGSSSVGDATCVVCTNEAHHCIASRRRNLSASEITRDALAAHLGLAVGKPRDVPFAAVGRSGHHSTAREMEELLAREWDDDVRCR